MMKYWLMIGWFTMENKIKKFKDGLKLEIKKLKGEIAVSEYTINEAKKAKQEIIDILKNNSLIDGIAAVRGEIGKIKLLHKKATLLNKFDVVDMLSRTLSTELIYIHCRYLIIHDNDHLTIPAGSSVDDRIFVKPNRFIQCDEYPIATAMEAFEEDYKIYDMEAF